MTKTKTKLDYFEKLGHQDDYIAGFKAGKAAYEKAPPDPYVPHWAKLDATDANRAYRKVSRKYGSEWIMGYLAAIDWGRSEVIGAATPNVTIAKKLGLTRPKRSARKKVGGPAKGRPRTKAVDWNWDDNEPLVSVKKTKPKKRTSKKKQRVLGVPIPGTSLSAKARKTKKTKTKKMCTSSGYGYRLEKANWRTAHDDFWEPVMLDDKPGTYVGEREIDGAKVVVLKQGRYYVAQTKLYVRSC